MCPIGKPSRVPRLVSLTKGSALGPIVEYVFDLNKVGRNYDPYQILAEPLYHDDGGITGHILTEFGDILTTESGYHLVKET